VSGDAEGPEALREKPVVAGFSVTGVQAPQSVLFAQLLVQLAAVFATEEQVWPLQALWVPATTAPPWHAPLEQVIPVTQALPSEQLLLSVEQELHPVPLPLQFSVQAQAPEPRVCWCPGTQTPPGGMVRVMLTVPFGLRSNKPGADVHAKEAVALYVPAESPAGFAVNVNGVDFPDALPFVRDPDEGETESQPLPLE
jgi:hypothetical protein